MRRLPSWINFDFGKHEVFCKLFDTQTLKAYLSIAQYKKQIYYAYIFRFLSICPGYKITRAVGKQLEYPSPRIQTSDFSHNTTVCNQTTLTRKEGESVLVLWFSLWLPSTMYFLRIIIKVGPFSFKLSCFLSYLCLRILPICLSSFALHN